MIAELALSLSFLLLICFLIGTFGLIATMTAILMIFIVSLLFIVAKESINQIDIKENTIVIGLVALAIVLVTFIK